MILLTLMILAASPAASTDRPPAEVIEVFRADFDNADRDFDDWPDGWKRQRGPKYPHYVRVHLAPAPGGPGHALKVELDGGAMALSSPPIQIGAEFSYLIEGRVKTSGLHRDEAYLSVAFLDEKQRKLETFTSERIGGTNDWVKLRLGPVSSTSGVARTAVLGLHVTPRTGQDITGTVWFDDVWLGRLPLVKLEASAPQHLYTDPAQVELICRASGLPSARTTLQFLLTDARGQVIDQTERRLQEGTASGKTGAAGALAIRWKPQISESGFYRASVTMQGQGEALVSRDTTLAVLPPGRPPVRGEFGWTLPHGEGPVPLAALPALLAQAGVNWVKFPIWLAEGDTRRSAAIAVLDERLMSQGIEVIGMLNEPPPAIRARFGESSRLLAGDVFTQPPDMWHNSLEPAMTALSMKVRWWQLGGETDTSFVGYPGMAERVRIVKRQLEQFGPQVRLTLGWGWLNELPHDEDPAWQALSLRADPPLTPEELTDYLQATKAAAVQRWVQLEPLAAGDYPPEVRANDLVRRIIAAKIGGAEAIFIPDPFDPAHGLLHADGSPSELFLPWRTAAMTMSGAEHLGSVDLPGGSRNEVFSRGHDAVMVVWNETPRSERLYLGGDAIVTDVWGRSVQAAREQGQQVIEVGPFPKFVTGISEPIVRIAMSTGFAEKQLPSVFGVAHPNPLQLRNYFPQGAGGRLRIIAPDGWVISPDWIDFRLSAGEELKQPVFFTLPFSANSGPQPIAIELEINGDRKHSFRIQRTIDVGLGDVLLETSTELNADGDLVVEQRVTNQTNDFVSFKCELSAPNRRLLRTQIFELSRGTDIQQYVIPNGKDLIGQTIWIRAVEIGGSRVLSQRYVAKP